MGEREREREREEKSLVFERVSGMAETEVDSQPPLDAVAAASAQAQAIADRIVQEQFHHLPAGGGGGGEAVDEKVGGEEDGSNKRKFEGGGVDAADNGDGPVRKKVYSGPEENPGAVSWC